MVFITFMGDTAPVLLLIMDFVILNIVQVAVNPRGDRRVDQQNTLTMF